MCGLLACGGEGATPVPGQREPTPLPDGGFCYDETVYRDSDGDGFGLRDESREACLSENGELDGYARVFGDCAPDDPSVNAGADEICGDQLDENCFDDDEDCPESQRADIRIPEWDCASVPVPDEVIAWAVFDRDNPYYEPGACFVFFEGLADEFYVKPVNLVPTPERARRGPDGRCEAVEGCICPSVDNWSYDRGRLYAMTLRGAPDDCDPIVVTSEAGEGQVVSNDCRKFLYQIWFNPNELSFVAVGEARLRRRLERFPSVEIACFEGQPYDDLPFASLLTAPIQWNTDFP